MTEVYSEEQGLPRSLLRTCLLVALAQGESHGYELLAAVQAMGLRSIDTGGLYRALRALDHDGLVESWWEASPAGPPRRSYRLTAAGGDALGAAVGVVEVQHRLIAALLERATELQR